jgi:tryptophan-rich sensory protein
MVSTLFSLKPFLFPILFIWYHTNAFTAFLLLIPFITWICIAARKGFQEIKLAVLALNEE